MNPIEKNSPEIPSKTAIQIRQRNGLKFLAIGAFVGFISCVLSILNPIESIYHINLYVCPTIAVALIFYGLYLIFE